MSVNDNDQLRPLIIDIGSNSFRMGWAGDDYPDIIAPSVYVDITDNLFTSDVIDGLEDIFIREEIVENNLFGREALKYQNILKIREFWKENNYHILLKYFNYYYQQLNITPENQYKQPLVIIAPFFTTELEKTQLQRLFFEYFKFPAILFISESQTILSALQKTSGVIVYLGESISYISTIFHGFTNIMARDIYPIAGKELTDFFLNMLLTEKGSGRSLYLDKWLAKEIKEKTLLCVLGAEEEKKRVKEGLSKYNQPVNFPDGSELVINSERFITTESLFNPKLIHIDYIGLPEAISKVIKSWDRENWEELISSIILSGGTSLIPGLKERLTTELMSYFSDKIRNKINITAVSGRENMGWIGASILYTKNQLDKGWIQNPEFQSVSNENIQQEQ